MLSGRAMQRHLVSLGIAAQKVVRKRETEAYVAEFFVPNMESAIASSQEWALSIRQALPHAHIIDTHDTIAAWRPDKPIIHATVVFHLSRQSAA